ncbi:MAG: hypothetical protein JO131_07085, partial [Gammaproteobacteria bacterium]|nr:hypothetical protein [Gammaproteobacteria bacterium]
FFEDCKPDVMVFEANEEGKTFWEREVIKLVVSLGYDLFEIPKSKFRVRLRKLNHGNSPQPSSWDFVAIRQGETYKNVIPSLDYMVYKTSNSSVLTYPIPPGKTNSKTEECYGEDSYGSASTMQRDLQNEWHNMR